MPTQVGKYRVNVTPNALANAKAIMDFYVNQMEHPPAAQDFLAAFEAKLPILAETPYLYPIPSNLPNFASLGYHRATLYKHHAMLYLVDDKTETVHVIYVVDTRQNLWLETPVPMRLIK